MKRIPYDGIIEISPNEPMAHTEWFKFLKSTSDTTSDVFLEALVQFYPDFDITKHTFPEEQLKIHKSVFQHFWWMLYHQMKHSSQRR